MDYSKIIQREVDRTFKVAGSLTRAVVFSKLKPVGYDFGSQAVVDATPAETLTIKGFPDSSVKKSREKGSATTVTKAYSFKTTEIPNPELFDTATFDGFTWRVVTPSVSDGYVTIVTFIREL